MLKKFQFFYFFQMFKPSFMLKINLYFFQKYTIFYVQSLKSLVYLSVKNSLICTNLKFKMSYFSLKFYTFIFYFFSILLILIEIF